ncbi:hypothetical protein C7S16_2763 [Burkholderia thailandensis]|uniref:Uncharacterized protein n=1 Tax=Burkholderia thailandensis TaxID=57975 RepID=A0AAW9D3V7_BURTH|nr:hypothetical protein [Burkholderia thailandensis]
MRIDESQQEHWFLFRASLRRYARRGRRSDAFISGACASG